ncbi:hypothetical protein [Mesorhizobium atlanticum]|uniref:hypothetical protein n=1 Tax=Mesorhizobium atlanticum TaxID=2233532 RepID=UPI0011BF1425|nr:hypothetical protein [Mesorhizobium atlanticum]
MMESLSGRFDPRLRGQGHIFISGTGRAGTTFLVQLFTELGYDTGTWSDADYFPHARAGLERDVFGADLPAIVKTPFLCDYVDQALFSGIQIDHVIIPVRRMVDAAASRAHVQLETTGTKDGKSVNGGLWGTEIAEEQADVLSRKFANLVEALVRHDISITMVSFPRSATDAAYLFRKLSPIIPSISVDVFTTAFNNTAKPAMIHKFS